MLYLAKSSEEPGVYHGNNLPKFTKPFLSWVAICSMSLVHVLDREAAEGVFLTCTTLSGIEDATESWWSSHLSGVLTLNKT